MKLGTSWTRRHFLLRGTAGAVLSPLFVPSHARGADGHTAPSERLTVACIGVRNMGNNHVMTLLGDRAVQLVGICDVDRAIREDRIRTACKTYADRFGKPDYQDTKGYSDFRELLQRDDLDAVFIATPDHTHAVIAIAAMQAGKDVFVEKPLALTIREGQAMVATARRYARVVQVGSHRRSSSSIRRVCELVRSGRIGKLLRVEVGCGSRPTKPQPWQPEPVPDGFDYDLWLGPAPWQPYTRNRCHYNFRFIRDYSGGELTNFGAHFLDVAQWGMGTDGSGPVAVTGRGEAHADGLYDVFYKFSIEYTYAAGVKLVCTSGAQGTKFVGTDGWIDDNGRGEPEPRLRAGLRPQDTHLYEAQASHIGEFLRCVRTRRDPSAPVEAGHRTATLSHLGNIAMALQRPLRWDPVREEFPDDDEASRMTCRAYRSPWTLG